MSDKYTPGYVNVPGKGMRYRNSQGEYFDNHFGSIFNSIGNAVRGVGDAYNSYYDGVADAAGTERRDGTVTKLKKSAATAQPPESSRGLPADYKKTEQQAFQKTEDYRNETRTNPAGVTQTGTKTGPKPTTMDDVTGVQDSFASTQLPATSANPYFNNSLDIGVDIDYSRKLPEDMFSDIPLNLTRNAFDAGSGVEFGKNLPQYPANGQIEYLQKDGAPLTVSSGTTDITEPNESAQEPEINKIPPKPRGGRQLQNWENKYERKVRAAEMAAAREKSEQLLNSYVTGITETQKKADNEEDNK